MTLSITNNYTQYFYAECHYAEISFKLSIAIKTIMLSVVMLNVVMLNVVAPQRLVRNFTELKARCHWVTPVSHGVEPGLTGPRASGLSAGATQGRSRVPQSENNKLECFLLAQKLKKTCKSI
jgi:hypothetical protein